MRSLLVPIVQSIGDGNEFGGSWSLEDNGWKYRISDRRT